VTTTSSVLSWRIRAGWSLVAVRSVKGKWTRTIFLIIGTGLKYQTPIDVGFIYEKKPSSDYSSIAFRAVVLRLPFLPAFFLEG
jgi:hypothetical protein